jgi:hypothetical protein
LKNRFEFFEFFEKIFFEKWTTSRDNTVNLLLLVVRFCILKFDPKKGTAEAQMPIPEPSDVEKCVHMNFEDQAECNKLTAKLERITKATEKVVAESEPSYLEPFHEKMNKFLEEVTGNLKDLNDLIQEGAYTMVYTLGCIAKIYATCFAKNYDKS